MSDFFDGRPPSRANPFVDENDEFDSISLPLNNTNVQIDQTSGSDNISINYSNSLIRIPSSSTMNSEIVEDYYSVLMPNVGIKSSIAELESAVQHLKLLFLDECEDSPRRGKIMERLIELRQDLHCAKEAKKARENLTSNSLQFTTSSTAIPSSVPTAAAASAVIAARSTTSATASISSSPLNPKQEQSSTILHLRGHEFVSTASPRHWPGGFCEQCCGHVVAKWFYRCTHCSALLHDAKSCKQLLMRSCPLVDLAPEHWMLPSTDEGRRARARLFSSEQLLNLTSPHLFGSLIDQEFSCAECHAPIASADSTFTSSIAYCQTPTESILVSGTERIVSAIASTPYAAMNKALTMSRSVWLPTGAAQSPGDAAGGGSSSSSSSSPQLNHRHRTRLPARVCHYTHRLYCPHCHWGDLHILPAHVLLLGECVPHPVCRSAYLRLRCLWRIALFRAPDAWLLYQPQAWEVFTARQKIRRTLLLANHCEVFQTIKLQLNERFGHYFLEQPYTFTMRDVLAVLENKLRRVVEFCIDNIRSHISSCTTCLSQCSECAVCQLAPVLSPLHVNATFCAKCDHVIHESCSISPSSQNNFQTICLNCHGKDNLNN